MIQQRKKKRAAALGRARWERSKVQDQLRFRIRSSRFWPSGKADIVRTNTHVFAHGLFDFRSRNRLGKQLEILQALVVTLVPVAIVVALLDDPSAVPAFVDRVESTCCDSNWSSP